MRVGFYVALVLSGILAVAGMSELALAQPNCIDFFHNADGSWSPTHPIMMESNLGTNTMISPETRFRAGTRSLPGFDLARYLDIHCGNRTPPIPRQP